MIYCLNTITIQPVPLPEKVKIVAQAGYQAIEIWFSDIRAYQNAGGSLDDLTKMVQDLGIQIQTAIALHGWMDAYGDTYIRAMEECKGLLSLAAKVGAQYVIASPSIRLESSQLEEDEVSKRFRELTRYGQEVGALPMMEFLGFSQKVSKISQAWEIVKQAGVIDAKVVVDLFHLWRGGSSLADVEDLTGEHIGIVHLSDVPLGIPCDRAGDEVRVMPGDGHLPLKDLIAELKRRGYKGAFSLELFNRRYWLQEPLKVAKIGLEKMQTLLG